VIMEVVEVVVQEEMDRSQELLPARRGRAEGPAASSWAQVVECNLVAILCVVPY
jgi:hypothetical protein